MAFREYLRIAGRRWKSIIACVALAIALAALVTWRATPQYISTARVFVSAAQADTTQAYEASLFSAQRVQSYADLANGQELARRVVDRLHLRMTPAQLTQKITASVAPSTVIVQISVTDPSPKQAQRLTQAVSQALTQMVANLETPPGAAKGPIKVTVVDPASLPATPASPQPVRNLGVGALLGLLVGIGIAAARETLDTSLKSPEEVVEITGAPVMGQIPFDPGAVTTALVTELETDAPRREAFRVLRTNLRFADVDRDSKVFVITSSVAEEGKTTTATNLAITMAQAGQEVLLLEADLRRPKVSDLLQLESAVGLSTVLAGDVPLDDAVQRSSVPGLSAMTSGGLPPNPSELVQSRAMSEALDQLRMRYDVIIVDAPPLLPVTDAALLGAQADGALLVARQGKTTREQVRHAVGRLDAVDARTLGVVLTMVPPRRAGSLGATYGYSYGAEAYRRIVKPRFAEQGGDRSAASASTSDVERRGAARW